MVVANEQIQTMPMAPSSHDPFLTAEDEASMIIPLPLFDRSNTAEPGSHAANFDRLSQCDTTLVAVSELQAAYQVP